MNMTVILITLVLLAASSYYVGLKKSVSIQKSEKLHSAPIYHGSLLSIYSLIVSLLFILIWYLFENYLYQDDVSKIPQELSEYLQKLIRRKKDKEASVITKKLQRKK